MGGNDYFEENKNKNKVNGEIVRFNYTRSNLFRVIHADGIWSSLTPKLSIEMTFWNERFPVPEQVSYLTTSKNEIEEIKEQRVIENAIIRDIEASILIDIETAERLIELLEERISEIREYNKPTNTDTDK